MRYRTDCTAANTLCSVILHSVFYMRWTKLPGPQPVASHPRMEALDSWDIAMKMNIVWRNLKIKHCQSRYLLLIFTYEDECRDVDAGSSRGVSILSPYSLWWWWNNLNLTIVKLSHRRAFIVRVIKGVVSMAASGNCTDLLIPSCPSQTFKWKYGGSLNYIPIHFNLILKFTALALPSSKQRWEYQSSNSSK